VPICLQSITLFGARQFIEAVVCLVHFL